MNAARSWGVGGGVSARVVALLTLAAFINFVDRGNRATAGPLIRDQFALSNAQLGLLLSAFFWSYTPAQLPAGWLAERFDARRVLACGLLVKARGLSITEMAQIGAGVYALSALACTLSGWVSDHWLNAGASSNRVRKTTLLTGLAGIAVSMSACALAGPLASLLAMAGCGICLGIANPAFYATAQALAGPDATARWFGVQNFFGNFAGITAPVITGIVVDRTGSFSLAFLIAAVLALVGMIAYGLIVRRIEPVDWYTPGLGRLVPVLTRQE
jgi:MFS family permease